MNLTFHTPSGIEGESMRIIQQELDEMGITLEPDCADVVRRAIHTTADFDYAKNLVFTPSAAAAGNILFAGNNNITPLDAAVETALHKIKEISSDIEIINKSLSTYIPFSCEERSILPFLGYECWVEEHPCLKAEFPDKYDILFLKADEERKKYNILFLNKMIITGV